MSAVSLQERAHRASMIARSVTEAQDQLLLAGQTEDLAAKLSVALTRALNAKAGLEEFGLPVRERELAEARQVVADAASAYLAEPTGANLQKARDSMTLLRSRADELESAAAAAWHDHRTKNQAPAIDRAYLTQLADAGFDVGAIEHRVALGDARLMLLKERSVPQPGDRATWDQSVAEMKEAAEALTNLAPPEVRSFLSAAVGGGASIDMVTPEVLRFLAERGLSRSFKVVRR